MATNFTVENDVQLKIYGIDFSFDSTDLEVLKSIDDFANSTQGYADKVVGRTDYIAALEETIQFVLDAIDSVLGEKASEQIFKDTDVSLNKALSVMEHISDEVHKARKQSMQKFTPERTQR
jgi:hypothetical protein